MMGKVYLGGTDLTVKLQLMLKFPPPQLMVTN